VSRKLKDGSVFFPDQRMSRMEALRSYTANNAYSACEENSKGSLKVGTLADITVLSKDILTIPEDEIPTAKVHHRGRKSNVSWRSQEVTGQCGSDSISWLVHPAEVAAIFATHLTGHFPALADFFSN
jgi:hypothetical protein